MTTPLPSFDAFAAELKKQGASEADAAILYMMQGGGAAYDAPAQAEEPGFVSDTGTALKSGWFETGAAMRGIGRALLPQSVFDAIDSLDGAGTPEERDLRWQARAAEITSEFSPEAQAAREKKWVRTDEEIEAGVGSAWLDPRSYWIGLMESIPGTAVTMGPTGFIARRAAQSAATKFLAGAEGRAITAQAGADAAMEAAKVAGGKAAQKTAIIAGGILEGAQGGGSAAEEVRAEIARMTPMQLQASDAYRALIEQGMSPEEAQASLKNDVGTQVFWAAGIATGIFGGRGDAMLQKAIGGTLAKSFTGRVARGAIEEGLLEEAPQGFFSTVGTNIAMQKVDPTRDPMEGALNQAAGGAVIGGLMGGGMAAALGRNRPEPNIDPAPPKLDGLTPDVAGEQLKAWSAEKTANVQAEMSRILQQRAAANDLASTQQEADLLAKMAQGRGMAATVEPVNVAAPAGFEAFTKDGNVSLGTYPDETSARRAFSGDERVDFRPLPAEGMTPGFFVNRQQVPGSETQEAPSFEYPTEEAARKLDPDGTRREIILSPGGFSSRAVDTARQAENIAALTRTAREENTNYLKEQAESIKDPVLKAEVLARAEEMAKTELRPAKDQPAAAYTRAYAETVGTEVQFVDIVSGPKFNGRVISVNGRRVLYINAASTVPHLQVTAHEVVHRMKTQYADLYDQAARELLPLWRPEARALMTARYRRNALSADGITEEMMGDFFATMSTDPQAMKALAKKNPTVWGKVATRIVEILDSILDLIVSGKKVPINSQLVKDLKKARAIYVNTMSEMGMRVRAEREQLTANAAAEAQEMAEGRQPATDGIAQPQPGTTEDGLPMMAQSEHHAARQPRDADGKFVEGPPADSLPDTTDEDYRADVAATSENRDALAGPAPEVVSGFAARSDFTEDGVENLTGRDRWMVVTAEDPGAKKATKKYNRQAMADLRAYLDERDIEHFPVTGKYGDVQNSIVVIGDKATIALAERLRKKFGQESVLIPEGLLYEKGMVHPADGTSRTDPNVDDFYTELPDGSRWQYGIIFDEKIALDKAIELRKGNALNKVPAARRAAEGLTATEKSDLTPATARKFAEVFSKLPPVDEIAAVAYAGKAKRGWYRRSAQAIAELFGPDGPRFAMLLAAMSPQTSVEANLLNALNMWKNWVADGRPTDEASIMKLLGRSVMQADLNERPLALLRRMAGKLNMPELSTKEELVAQFESAMARSERMAARIKELSVLDAWVNNTVRALSTEFPGKVKLSGPKVTSFYLNLLDNVEEVTNDAWMATFSYVEQALFSGIARKDETGQSVGQKSGGYLAMSSKVRSAARRLTELTGDTWTPAEVQETVWSWTKAIYELRGKKGEKRSTIELLMDGEVTDKLIGSVPDFNDLFNETTYLGILHEAGYKPESLSLRSRGGERARAERGTAGKAAAPFEGVEQAALEFAVAGRLERRFNSIGDPGQLDSGPAEPAVRPGREGSVSGVGVHFGQSGDVPVLSGAAFGRGIKGKEKERVLRSTDPRIKRRIYFYIAAPGQQFDVRRREAGLGTHVYRAELGNLYESGKSPKLEFERAYINEEFKILDNEENLTRTEIAILDAGYDGYVVRNPDIAVVLNKDVRVRYLGQLGQGRFDIPGEAPLEATFAEDMEAQSREIERAAKEAGFASPDEMLRNAPESFFALAEKWRDENPRTPDVVDGAGMLDSMPPPKKTIKAYKQFATKIGKSAKYNAKHRNRLYPLFIGASIPAPQGEWIKAEYIPTKGYAERPGWHAGVEPIAPHLRGLKAPHAGKIQVGRVWAEVELPADVDWQTAADNSPTRDIRGKIPERGTYRFKTTKMQGGAWHIAGGIKVNRILSNEEVASILRAAGHSQEEIDAEMQDMSTVNADVGQSESGGLLDSIPGFYSTLDREVDKASMKAAQASAWLQYLKNRPGMKPDEFEWTGVGDWLAARGNDRITKGELQDWMAANSKDINEVVTGAHLPFRLPTGVSITFEGDDDIDGPWLLSIERVNQMGGYGSSARYHSEEAAYQAARAHLEGVGVLEEAQYEKYTLPGGKEYTELLITLDQKSQPITRRMIEDAAREYVQQQFDERGDRFADNQQVVDAIKDDPFAWTELWEEAVAKKLNLPFKSRMFRDVGDGPNGIMLDDPHNFKSGHFETPNVVAHLRFKSRLDADNRRVMFIEEIQSDWAQAGRKKGFTRPFNEQEHNRLLDAMKEADDTYAAAMSLKSKLAGDIAYWGKKAESLGGKYDPLNPDAEITGLEDSEAGREVSAKLRAAIRAHDAQVDALIEVKRARLLASAAVVNYKRPGVPVAPFVQRTDSWTALALKRAILWAIENDFDAVAWTTGEQQVKRYEDALTQQVDMIAMQPSSTGGYIISAYKNDSERSTKTVRDEAEAADFVGKEMAQKLFARKDEGRVELTGLDLKIGGDGMRESYNLIVPKVAKDVLRKLKGPSVEVVRFNEGSLSIEPSGPVFMVKMGDTIVDMARTRQRAEEIISQRRESIEIANASRQLGFVIPEEWKKNPIEVPLFSEEFDYYDEKPSLEGLEAASITDLIATVRSDLSRLPEMPDRAVERLGRDWMEIGKRDELYSYRGSRDTDMENVAYDMSGRRVRVFKENPTELDVNLLGDLDVGGEPFIPVEKYRLDLQLTREQQLEVGHKTVPAFVYVDEIGHVAMNIQAFQRGVTNGNLIYQIVGTWAYNNELVFIGDPAGLSEAAIFRRAENMFVNALRTGSTRHLFPHPYQVAAGLEWRDGNDQFNIGSLALFNKRVLDLYRNELTRTGKASKNPDAMLATEAIPAGRRTAARAAMTTELLDRIENDLPGMQGGAPMPQLPVEKPLYSIDVTYEDIRNTVSDMMRSEKSVNFWDKTVGTQLAKARRFPAFGRVYNAVQKFMNDTSLLANAAAEKAPEILRQMDHWGDIIPAIRDAINPQSRKDRAVASTLLLDGRVHDRVWSKEDAMKRGATERQYHLYRQMRNAINVSLDQLATSDLYRITRDMGLDDARAKIMGLTTDKAAKLLLDAIDALPNFNEKQQQALEFVRNEINEKARRIQHLKATGYAPLMRFGRYTIEYEVDGERAFNMFETEGDRNKFERELQKSGAKIRRTGMLSTEAHKLYKGFDPAALEVFGQMTTLEFFDEQGNVRKASISETEMFQQFLRQATANHSALRRLIKAKKVPGYSEDGSRILASFVTSNARMASRNLNMQEMVKAASVADGPDKRDGDIKDEAIKLVKYVQDGQEEAQALRGLMFVNYLGGSVASALVNMSQPIMMSWPTLSRWGAGKAAAALSRGFKQAVSRRAPGGRLGADLQLAQEQGIVSPQEIHHLQAEASRTLGSNPILRAGLMAWGSLFSAAEQFNRRATFIAAWEIGNDLGMSELSKLGYDSVYQFAVDQVIETQGTYNRGNRPNWARGAVGATVFTFKQYSIHYLEWLTRLPKWQRAQALAILVFVSGVQGLPFADDLDDLIDALAQNMGYVWSTKDAKRQFLSSIVGKDLANFVMSGASTLPGVPLDVQGRLSMGSLLPGSGMLKPGATMREALEILGPVGGMIDSYTKGAKSILSGDALEAAIGFSPLAVKNLLKGADMIQTGAYRDMQGRKVVDATFMDAVVKTIGFMPPEAAEAGRRERSVQELVNLTRTGQTNIQRKWAEGIFTGDQGLVAEARDDLRKWNERNPGATIRLDMKAIQRRVAEMRKTRAERMRGNAPRSARDIVKNRLED